jgi:hypothetical protein
MVDIDWMRKLYHLMYRFENLGITADIAAMSAVEAWGLYRYLSRLAGD